MTPTCSGEVIGRQPGGGGVPATLGRDQLNLRSATLTFVPPKP